jgi:hypothetical protein
MPARRYAILLLPALAVWLLMTGCYTQFYRASVNGPPEAISAETLYDRYDSSAVDTTLTKGESYPGGYSSGYDYYDRWDLWGRPRFQTRWGFDFYNYSPPYYWGYYGWEDYYGNPWWYSGYYDSWYPYGTTTPGTPAEPPSKRPFGRRDGENSSSPPPSSVTRPSNPPPSYASPPSTPAPSRPSGSEAQKSKGQRDFGRRKR